MAQASLLADIGRCDDNAYLSVNGNVVVSVPLNRPRRYQRLLQDGTHEINFRVTNDGGWAWAARLRLLINGTELAAVDQIGGTGFWAGEVYYQSWQVTIVNGIVSEFVALPEGAHVGPRN